jgi:hypothetical protein
MLVYFVPQAIYYVYFMFTERNSALEGLSCGNVMTS